jgi:hypothetical protein
LHFLFLTNTNIPGFELKGKRAFKTRKRLDD